MFDALIPETLQKTAGPVFRQISENNQANKRT